MYLSARKHISKNDYSDRENIKVNPDFEVLSSIVPKDLTKFSAFSGISISYPVGYWRKANAIHGWFVNELAGGVDECQEIPLDRGHLEILRDSCKAVLAASDMEEEAAEHNLEPTQGFFFGAYAIDEYYIQDLKDTVNMIDNVLSIVPEGDYEWQFIYQASW